MKTSIYEKRWDYIKQYVVGKSVLDIGPAELIGTINSKKRDTALHVQITKVAADATGLELNPLQARKLRELGYNVIDGNAETFSFNKTYDVIVAGELIEHLSNPGMFLERAKEHLKEDGVLILTTPNRFYAAQFISAYIKNSIPVYDKPIAKHVAYYDEVSLKDLLARHGYDDIQISYYRRYGSEKGNRLSVRNLVESLLVRRRYRFAKGLIVVAKLKISEIQKVNPLA